MKPSVLLLVLGLCLLVAGAQGVSEPGAAAPPVAPAGVLAAGLSLPSHIASFIAFIDPWKPFGAPYIDPFRSTRVEVQTSIAAIPTLRPLSLSWVRPVGSSLISPIGSSSLGASGYSATSAVNRFNVLNTMQQQINLQQQISRQQNAAMQQIAMQNRLSNMVMQTNMQRLTQWGRTSSLPSSSPMSPFYTGISPSNPFSQPRIQPITIRPISNPGISSPGSAFNRPGGIGSSYSGISGSSFNRF